MPGQARLDAPGTLHHVIVRGIERRKIVDNDTDREEFVDRMGKIAQESETQLFPGNRKKRARQIISRMCEGEGVPVEEIHRGSTRRLVSKLRGKIAVVLVVEEGMSMADTARLLGVTTPAISSAIRKLTN